MKKFLFLGIIGLCFLACGCKKEQENPNKDENKEKFESIAVYDKSHHELTRDNVYQQESSSAIYNHENVYVFAIYKDKTSVDITSFASFSAVDLTQLGEQTVTVSYYNHTCTYILEVFADSITKISLDVTSARRLFTIGETFTTSGLIVSATYKSGRKGNIDTYTSKVTDANNISYTRVPFQSAGIYDVSISAGKGTASYQIAVKDKKANLTESFDLSVLDREYDIIEGKYTAPIEEKIFDGEIATILTKEETVFRNKDENGDLLRQSYDGKDYTRTVEVANEQQITIIANQAVDLVLLTSFTVANNLLFVSNDGNQFSYAIGNTTGKMSVLYVRLLAGTYTMQTVSDSICIYNFDFYQISRAPASNIERLELDTTYAKKQYKVGEDYSYSHVELFAYYKNGTSEQILGYDWDHEAVITLDGEIKSSLDVPGIYLVTVYYKNHTVSYEIIVTEN